MEETAPAESAENVLKPDTQQDPRLAPAHGSGCVCRICGHGLNPQTGQTETAGAYMIRFGDPHD